jgi:hypothetical protein
MKNTELVMQYAEGEINDNKYYAMVSNQGGTDNSPAIFLLKNKKNSLEEVFKLDIAEYPPSYSVMIKNNSFYIRFDTAHHGVHFSQYQFKKIKGQFFLIGIEYQSMALVEPTEATAKDLGILESWEGTSLNLLTSKAECWQQTFNLTKGEKSREWKEWNVALDRHKKGLRSSNAIIRKGSLHRSGLIPLKSFDIYEATPSFTCHLD